ARRERAVWAKLSLRARDARGEWMICGHGMCLARGGIMSIHAKTLAPLLLVLGAAACSDNDSGSLQVTNQSDFQIVEMHVTAVGNTTFGPNLLANAPLQPGDAVTVATSCDTFDVLLVDEQGVSCQIHNINLCDNNADFVIRNETCAVFGAAAAK